MSEHSNAAKLVTPEGVEVKVGQIWHSLDRHEPGRHVKVLAVEQGKGFRQHRMVARVCGCHANGDAFTARPMPTSTLSVDRMCKRNGWELVACQAAAKLAQQAERVAEASPAQVPPVVCAWCNPVDPAAPLPPEDQRVSHGICPEHKRQMLAQMHSI